MTNTAWQVSGEYFETCSCDYLCPCIPTNLAGQPTKGYCNFAFVFHVEKGHHGNTKLDGLTFAAIGQTPGVMGMGNMLDVSRFKNFIADTTKMSRAAIDALVIGEHGENMLPLVRYSSISGIPLMKFLDERKAKQLVEDTRKVAAEVIALKGATIYAPANAVTHMVDAIVKDRKEVMPVAAYLDGEYNAKDICIGVPAVLGKDGVEEIVELELNAEEKEWFDKGVKSVKDAVSGLSI